MCFSTMYASPGFVEMPLRIRSVLRRPSSTMASLVRQAGRRTFGTWQLLAVVEAQGVEECGQEEYWPAGKASVGAERICGVRARINMLSM